MALIPFLDLIFLHRHIVYKPFKADSHEKIFGICFFVLMTGCILTHSSLSLAYAALGLESLV